MVELLLSWISRVFFYTTSWGLYSVFRPGFPTVAIYSNHTWVIRNHA